MASVSLRVCSTPIKLCNLLLLPSSHNSRTANAQSAQSNSNSTGGANRVANLVGQHVLTGGPPEEAVETSFVLQTFLAGGAFGQVYSALDEKTGAEVAVKLERYDAQYRQLYLEFGFYQRLGRECHYAPRIHFFGQVGHSWHALVMELLGPSLKKVQVKKNEFVARLGNVAHKKFSSFHSFTL